MPSSPPRLTASPSAHDRPRNAAFEQRQREHEQQLARRRQPRPRPHQDFGQRLTEALADARILTTQAHLAEMFGVTQTTVGTWLRGAKLPPVEMCVELAKMTGVSIEWLVLGQGTKHPLPDNPIIELARQIAMAPQFVQDILRAVLTEALRPRPEPEQVTFPKAPLRNAPRPDKRKVLTHDTPD